MHPIGNEATAHARSNNGRTQKPRFPMVQWRHGIKSMGDHGGSPIERGHGFRCRGLGMAKADGNSARSQPIDRLARGIQFRREGHLGHLGRVGANHRRHLIDRQGQQELLWMGPALLWIQERPLKMCAPNFRPIARWVLGSVVLIGRQRG